VPPGTLFDIPFMNIITICTPENTKNNGKIVHKTILDFHCKMECTRAEFTEMQEISIQSYYPLTHFERNQLFQTFRKKAFKQIESNILLQVSISILT
jgi:tyrosine-protein phosphatase YwqE